MKTEPLQIVLLLLFLLLILLLRVVVVSDTCEGAAFAANNVSKFFETLDLSTTPNSWTISELINSMSVGLANNFALLLRFSHVTSHAKVEKRVRGPNVEKRAKGQTRFTCANPKKRAKSRAADATVQLSHALRARFHCEKWKRAVEGSNVSPLRNTMGGLSGWRRGVTHQESVLLLHSSSPGCLPELWPWIWPVESVAPPFFIRKAYASDGSSTPRRKSSAMR